jgi:inactivated superfamily I helicase
MAWDEFLFSRTSIARILAVERLLLCGLEEGCRPKMRLSSLFRISLMKRRF